MLVLDHERRRILHFNVTNHPNQQWAAPQIVEAIPDGARTRYLVRDSVYGAWFRRRVKGPGLDEVLCAPRTPQMNAFVERLIGTIRREILDHVIVINEAHLHRLLREYAECYNTKRTHLALAKDAPEHRDVLGLERGSRIAAIPHLGGPRRHYERRAA